MNIYILFPLDTAHMKHSFLTLKACVPTRVNSLCLFYNSFHKIRNRSQQEEEGEAAFVWVQLFRVGRYVSKGLEVRPIVCRFESVAASDIFVYINMRIIVKPHSHYLLGLHHGYQLKYLVNGILTYTVSEP